MTASGVRLKAIAAKYGCSAQTVLNRMNEAGIQAHPQHSMPGELNPAWKGGRYSDGKGYVMVFAPDHPFADCNRRVREHRLVMEQMIGRYLQPGEVVDHRDGDGMNNHPDNLRLFASNAEHLAATLAGKCPEWSNDGKARIQEAVRQPRKPWIATHRASRSDARLSRAQSDQTTK